jgi:hypothetical protein
MKPEFMKWMKDCYMVASASFLSVALQKHTEQSFAASNRCALPASAS